MGLKKTYGSAEIKVIEGEQVKNHAPILAVITQAIIIQKPVGLILNSNQIETIDKTIVTPENHILKKEVFPHRVTYLDGDLELIAENCEKHYLEEVLIEDIKTVEAVDKNYGPLYKNRDIENLINYSRLVLGNEVRLILKVITDGPVDLAPPFHYFSSPYTAINAEGQIIWAGSVEVSEALLEWLACLKGQVQILDPPSLEKELELYLELLKK